MLRQKINTPKCPLCGSSKGKEIFKSNSSEVAQFHIPLEKNKKSHNLLKKILRELWKSDECKVVKCSNCKLGYAWPFIAGNLDFYSLIYDSLKYPGWKSEYDLTLNELKKLSKYKKIKILEVGAGAGIFAKKISQIFGKKSITCLEYSDAGISEMKKQGIICHNEDIKNFSSSERFSGLCMFQVLEHLDNLNELFKKISELTTDDADIFFSVPDEETINFNERFLKFMDYPPNHVTRWNKHSIGFLSKKYGFKIENYQRVRYKYSQHLKDFCFGLFEVKRTKKNSIPNQIDKMKNLKVRAMFKLFGLIFYLPTAIKKVPLRPMSKAQWIHLKKRINPPF